MLKQVIVMRTDLNMRKGKMVAQGAHVSMMFITKNFESHCAVDDCPQLVFQPEPQAKQWLEGSFTKICVGIDSLEGLQDIFRKARMDALEVHVCEDNGTTEFHGEKTATCLAIGPDESEKIDKITGHLKLI